MRAAFPSLRFCVLVGIGGGVPTAEADVRLGDVVVSKPNKSYGGVVQYDFGKSTPDGFEQTGFLNAPPTILLNAVSRLQADHDKVVANLTTSLSRFNKYREFRREIAGPDLLFEPNYDHVRGPTCEFCNSNKILKRPSRERIAIHYGTIASGNQVIRHGATRDRISAKFGGVLCFEMEAAGLMNAFPCIVIRGICDYADSHKNKNWQPYAAATAATFAKELLSVVPSESVAAAPSTYRIPFSLKGAFTPKLSPAKTGVRAARPRRRGKTQLAAEFLRRHHTRFSAAFWLDGNTLESLRQSIGLVASRLPEGQISESSRMYSQSGTGDLDAVIADVMRWLSRPDNHEWILVIDNVDREYGGATQDSEAYDITDYFPESDHGSLLITSRLAKLEQSFTGRKLGKVDETRARAIFQKWYGRTFEPTDGAELFELLDGLPLAIAQAGAYMRETGISFPKYVEFYKSQWGDLMQTEGHDDMLHDYQHRSVWTTWTISYNKIRERNGAAANLLLLWAHMDRMDLCYEFLAAAAEAAVVRRLLSSHISDLADQELRFIEAIRLLQSYSLVEALEDTTGFLVHPVVHKWALNIQDKAQREKLGRLSIITIGYALPHRSKRRDWVLQQRLFSHVQVCTNRFSSDGTLREGLKSCEDNELKAFFEAVRYLCELYGTHSRLAEAEAMYQLALQEMRTVLGPEHLITLKTVHDLASSYRLRHDSASAEKLYEQALQGYNRIVEQDQATHPGIYGNLGNLYVRQGKLAEAEKMYEQALKEYNGRVGPDDTSTLRLYRNLGRLYAKQGKLNEAEAMYQQALRGYNKLFGPAHMSTLRTYDNLGRLYAEQGKMAEAEEALKKALQGYEEVFGPENAGNNIHALLTIEDLAHIHWNAGRLKEAREMYQRALSGFQRQLGSSNPICERIVEKLNNLEFKQGTSLPFGIMTTDQLTRRAELRSSEQNTSESEKRHESRLRRYFQKLRR